MEGVTGMMAWLSHVPGCSRAGLYGPANIDFRFVSKLRLQRASKNALAGLLAGRLASPLRPPGVRYGPRLWAAIFSERLIFYFYT